MITPFNDRYLQNKGYTAEGFAAAAEGYVHLFSDEEWADFEHVMETVGWMKCYGIEKVQVPDYRKAFDRILRLISNPDPVGLLAFCPDDEYDIEADEILRRLGAVATAEEARRLVEDVFSELLALRRSFPPAIGPRLLAIKDTFLWPPEAY